LTADAARGGGAASASKHAATIEQPSIEGPWALKVGGMDQWLPVVERRWGGPWAGLKLMDAPCIRRAVQAHEGHGTTRTRFVVDWQACSTQAHLAACRWPARKCVLRDFRFADLVEWRLNLQVSTVHRACECDHLRDLA
jgi:hypothetical protein